MIRNILAVIFILLFLLSCDRRDCIVRASHMEMDYQYCNSIEGMKAIKKAYDRFLSDSIGETEYKCECEYESESIKEELEVCRIHLDSLKRQLSVKSVRGNNSEQGSDWRK